MNYSQTHPVLSRDYNKSGKRSSAHGSAIPVGWAIVWVRKDNGTEKPVYVRESEATLSA